MRQATRYPNITLFAPRNAAWDEPGVKMILQDKKRMKDLLNLHYVREYLPLDVIEKKTLRQVRFNVLLHFSVNFAIIEAYTIGKC